MRKLERVAACIRLHVYVFKSLLSTNAFQYIVRVLSTLFVCTHENYLLVLIFSLSCCCCVWLNLDAFEYYCMLCIIHAIPFAFYIVLSTIFYERILCDLKGNSVLLANS